MWSYEAQLVRVIDGDTVVLKLTKDFSFQIDFGFNILEEIKVCKSTELSFRLLGINAPEVVGAAKAEGFKSKAELERLLCCGPITATTYKPDKYGRWLVTLEVTLPDNSKLNVNDELVKTGYAIPYMV